MRKDITILKPKKKNGVVSINNVGYYQSLEHLFIDEKNLKKLIKIQKWPDFPHYNII